MVTQKMDGVEILSSFQKPKGQIQRVCHSQTKTKLQTQLKHLLESQAKLQTQPNYVIENLKVKVQLREQLEVLSHPTIDQTQFTSILDELEEQIERIQNPQLKTKLRRKLNYAAQEAQGGTDVYLSQLQMVKEEVAILRLNRVMH